MLELVENEKGCFEIIAHVLFGTIAQIYETFILNPFIGTSFSLMQGFYHISTRRFGEVIIRSCRFGEADSNLHNKVFCSECGSRLQQMRIKTEIHVHRSRFAFT